MKRFSKTNSLEEIGDASEIETLDKKINKNHRIKKLESGNLESFEAIIKVLELVLSILEDQMIEDFDAVTLSDKLDLIK